MNNPSVSRRITLRNQRGATLFIALMILILLTLLALSAAQVTGLQERMAGVYRADNQAFQSAEDCLRDIERTVLVDPLSCELAPETDVPTGWIDGSSTSAANRLENLNKPGSITAQGIELGGSKKVGQSRVPGSANCLVFRASCYNFDNATNRASYSVVQSTFTP